MSKLSEHKLIRFMTIVMRRCQPKKYENEESDVTHPFSYKIPLGQYSKMQSGIGGVKHCVKR